MSGKNSVRWAIAVVVSLLWAVPSGQTSQAATYTWINAGTAWASTANWSGSTIPGSGDVGLFNSNVIQPSVGATSAIGGIWDTGSGNLTIGGASTLSITGTTVNNHALTGIEMDAGAGSLTISAPLTLTGSQTWLNNASNPLIVSSAVNNGGFNLAFAGTGNFSLSNVISNGSVTMNGSGTLTFGTQNNTYTGGTIINGGTLALGTGSGTGVIRGALTISSGATVSANTNWSLGYNGAANCVSSITISGGLLNFNGTNDNGGTSASSIIMTGGTISGSHYDWYNGITSTPTLSSSASSTTAVVSSGFRLRLTNNNITFNVARGTTASGTDLLISGPITSAFSDGIIKTGTGQMTLTAANTYGGATTISAGTLQISGGGVLGNGSYGAGITNNGVLVYSTSSNQTLSGAISGTGGFFQSGSGQLILSGPNNFSNGVTVTSGVLEAAKTSSLPSFASSLGTANVASGATLAVAVSGATGWTSANIDSLFNNSNINLQSGALLGIDTTPGNFTYASSITTANLGFNKLGTNSLTLTGSNTYTGPTVITAGTLVQGVAGSIPQGSPTVIGTLDLNGINYTANGLAGAGTVTNSNSTSTATLTVGAADTTSTFAGVMQNGSGTLALTKAGTGTLNLTNFSTYSGGTIVNGGTLALPAGGATGIIRGALTINSSGTVNANTNWSFGYNGAANGVSSITINGGLLNFSGGFNSGGFEASNIAMTGGTISGPNGSVPAWYNGITSTPTLTTSAASTTAVISSGFFLRLNNNNATFNVASGSTPSGTDLLISGTISSGFSGDGIVKTGAGTMTLSAPNTFSGGTTLAAGGLNINHNSALGTGTFAISGGTIDSTTSGITLANNPQTWNGDFAFKGSNNLNLGAGAITLGTSAGTSRTLTVSAGTLTVGGNITNGTTANSLVKAGAGTLVLGGVNSYSGATVIAGGTIKLAPLPTAPTAPVAGSSLWLDASDTSSISAFGGAVSSWNDKSGNGYNATGGGAATTGAAFINGHNAISFNGTSNYLIDSGTYAGQMVFVVSARDTSDANTLQGVISARTASSVRTANSHSGIGFGTPNIANSNLVGNGDQNGSVTGVWVNGIAAPTSSFNTGGASGVPAWVGTTGVTAPSIVELQDTSATSGAQNLVIGADTYNVGGRYFGGLIGEVLVYSSSLTTAQRQSVESYLNAKWFGTGSNLPAASPVQITGGATLDLNGATQTVASLSDYNGTSGSVINSSTQSATLTFSPSAGTTTFTGVIAGGGALGTINLAMNGPGTQFISGANTYTGTTSINSGNLGGQVPGVLNATGGGWSGSGSVGGLVTVSTGAFTINSGATLSSPAGMTITGGKAYINGTLSAGTVAVAANAALDGNGTLGSATVATGGHFGSTQSATDKLTLTNLAIGDSGSVVNLVASPTAVSGLIVSTSNGLNLTGGSNSVTINISGINGAVPGTNIYHLIQYSGAIQGAGYGGFALGAYPAGARTIVSLQNDPGYVDLNVTSDTITWTGGTNEWSTGVVQNWKLTTSGSATNFLTNDVAIFDNSASNRTVDINQASVAPLSATFNNDAAHSYTLQSSANPQYGITGAAIVTKMGTGTLTITTSGNDYTGGTLLQNGTIALGISNGLPIAGTVTFGAAGTSGTLDLAGNNQQLAGLAIGLGASASGQVIGNSSTASISTLTYSSTGATSFAGTIQDTVGSGNQKVVVSVAAGLLNLGGANTYSGATSLNGGTLQLGNTLAVQNSTVVPNGGNLDINGLNAIVGGLSGAGALTLTSGTLNVGNNAANTTFSGTLSGNVPMAKIGAGKLTLASINNYTGGTTLANGTLSFDFNTLPTTGAITMAGGTLQWYGFNTQDISNHLALVNGAQATFDTNGNNVTLASVFGSGTSGSLNKIGAGTLTLSPINSYTGGTVVNGGTLFLGNGSSVTGNIRGSLTINAGANVSASTTNWSLGYDGQNVGGSNNNIVNSININGGSLTFRDTNANGGLAASSVAMTGGTIGGSQFDWYNGITNNPSLTTNASSATSVLVGGINLRLNGGVLTLNVAQGTTPSGVDLLISGPIIQANAGGITKTGSGMLVLGAADTYTGNTTITAGTLQIGNALAMQNSTVVLSSTGGLLDINGYSATLGGLSGDGVMANASGTLSVGNNGSTTTYSGALATGGLIKLGGGVLTLAGTAANSTGDTLVNAGTLVLAKPDNTNAISGNLGISTASTTFVQWAGNNQMPSTAAVNFFASGALVLEMLGHTQMVAGISGAGYIENRQTESNINNSGTFTISNSADCAYSGHIRDFGAGSGSGLLNIVKSGSAMLTLSGAGINYTGDTSVTGGTLNFANNGSASGNAPVTTVTLSNNSVLMFTATSGQTSDFRGNAFGAGSIVIADVGTVRFGPFGGTSQFAQTGDVNVQAGILRLAGQSNYQMFITTGNLIVNSGATVSWSGSNDQGANTASTFGGLQGGGTISGDAGTPFAKIGNGDANGTFSGVIAGSLSIIKMGSGTQYLSGPIIGGFPTSSSSFTGNVTVNAGKLVAAALGTTLGASSNTRTITVNAGGTLEFDAPNVTAPAFNSTNVPALVINGGIVTNADPAASGAVNNALNNVTLSGGTLTATTGQHGGYAAWNINGTITSSGASLISTTDPVYGTVMLSSAGSQISTVNVSGGTLTVSAPLVQDNGDFITSGLTKTGSGTLLLLSSSNAYTGATTINAGTLIAGLANAMAAGSVVTLNAGLLDLTAGSQTIGGLTVTGGQLNLHLGNLLTSTAYSTLGGTLNIFGTPSGTVDLINFPGAYTGAFTAGTLPANYALSYNPNGTELDLVLATVNSAVWTSVTSGSWTGSSNWSPAVPSGQGVTALLGGALATSGTVTLDGAQTLGTLVFNNSASYTLAAGNSGSLTMDNTGGSAQIVVLSGTHSIAAPLTLAGTNTSVALSNNGSLGISGNILDGSGGSAALTLSSSDGTGLLTLSGTNNTFGGGMNVTSGVLVLNGAGSLLAGSSLTIGSASLGAVFAPPTTSRAVSPNLAPVPEPGTLTLFAVCAAAMGFGLWRRKRKKGNVRCSMYNVR